MAIFRLLTYLKNPQRSHMVFVVHRPTEWLAAAGTNACWELALTTVDKICKAALGLVIKSQIILVVHIFYILYTFKCIKTDVKWYYHSLYTYIFFYLKFYAYKYIFINLYWSTFYI